MNTIIPVVRNSGRCVVYTGDPESERKLDELYAYIKHLPTADNWDIPSLAGSLLKQTFEVMQESQVYACELVGVDVQRHGQLVFVLHSFMSAGTRITWQIIADDIDEYLSALENVAEIIEDIKETQ